MCGNLFKQITTSAIVDKDIVMRQSDKNPCCVMSYSWPLVLCPGYAESLCTPVLGDGCYIRLCNSETLFFNHLRVFWSCPIRLGLLLDLLMSSPMPLDSWVDCTTLGAWEANPFLSHHTRSKALPKERVTSFVQGYMNSILCELPT